MGKYIGASYAVAKATWEAASPYLQVSPGNPAMFLYHGNGDRIVQPAELIAMQAQLERNGVPVEIRQVPVLGPIATFLWRRASRSDGIDFLDRYLRAKG